MERKKIGFLAVVLISLCFRSNSQNNEIIRPGLIRVMGTISPSKMLGMNDSYFYLHGNFEAYLNKKVSFCGDAYYFLGAQSGKSTLEMNHNIFYGLLLHFTKNTNDLYMGIQPGVAITKLNPEENGISNSSAGTNPVFSAIAGYNFYVNPYFNFFIQSRFILGEHNYDLHKDISELRLSAGLGFNLNVLKQKK